MKFQWSVLRALRNAISTISFVLCAVFVALWLRSYHWQEQMTLGITSSDQLIAVSDVGWISGEWIMLSDADLASGHRFGWGWHMSSRPVPADAPVTSDAGFRLELNGPTLVFQFPHWLPIAIALVVGISPWIRWSKRFSLRTLLFMITLVALILGIIRYLPLN